MQKEKKNREERRDRAKYEDVMGFCSGMQRQPEPQLEAVRVNLAQVTV